MPVSITRWARKFSNRYLLFIPIWHVYLLLAHKMGSFPIYSSAFRLEMPILLGIYWYLNRVLRENWMQPFIAAIPIFSFYAIYDAYYFAFSQTFKLAAIHELPALFLALPIYYGLALVILGLIPITVFIAAIDWQKRFQAITIGISCLSLFVASLHVYPQTFIEALKFLSSPEVECSEYENAGKNGRLVTLLLREAERQQALRKLKTYKNDPEYIRQANEVATFIASNNNGHSVHLLILESLLDPSLFNKLKLSRDPYSAEFRKIFGERIGFSISPVFGGGTSQAEFEALCGVPAYQEYGKIEFNLLKGNHVGCLPDILHQSGYRTLASHPCTPQMFNLLRAYPALGFSESYFPKEYYGGETYLSVAKASPVEGALFDGDFFDQTLQFLGDTHAPIFNYMLGLYGHYPSSLDSALRPVVIGTDSHDTRLNDVVNQFYYRTGAIADIIGKLSKKPCLIIVTGDHLPALAHGMQSYSELQYLPSAKDPIHTTRIFIMRDGKPIVYPLIHHYDIPNIILDYVTDGKYCRHWPCTHRNIAQNDAAMMSRYRHILAEGI